jgi:hypothetical protein
MFYLHYNSALEYAIKEEEGKKRERRGWNLST